MGAGRDPAPPPNGQDDDAVFEVAVDGALRGEARPAFEAERVQAGGDGKAFLEKVLNEAVGEMDGHHRPSSLGGVGLLGALLGQEGGILGVNPAAMDFVAQQDAGEPGLQLALQPTVRKTAEPRVNALRPRLTFSPQRFCRATRPSFIQCSPTRGNALHAFMSAFLSDCLFCLPLILAATPTSFIPSLRPPGGATRAFFLLPFLDPFYCATSRGVGGVRANA